MLRVGVHHVNSSLVACHQNTNIHLSPFISFPGKWSTIRQPGRGNFRSSQRLNACHSMQQCAFNHRSKVGRTGRCVTTIIIFPASMEERV